MKVIIKIVLLLVCSISFAQTNLLDTSTWTAGTGSVVGFNINGTSSENSRALEASPHGLQKIIWKSQPEDNTGERKGWVTDYVDISHDKTYRYTSWIKKTNSKDGFVYLTLSCIDDSNNNTGLNLNGSVNGAPYAFSDNPQNLDEWYLLVGYIHQSSYSSTTSMGGVYDTNGVKKSSMVDYKFSNNATKLRLQNILWFSTNTSDQLFTYAPTIYEVNGQEPTIQELIDGPDTQAPTAPTLSSTAQTDTTVDLSWTAATDNVAVTGYRVYKDAILETTLGNVLSYQVTGLTASTTYDFTVTALDAAGNESAVSNTVAITTDAASGNNPVQVSSKIALSEEDSEERISDGFITITSNDLDFIDGTIVGLYFKALNIPQGATIQNAYIQFTANLVTTGTSTLSIVAEASDAPQIWSSTSGDISSRPKTSASVQWSPQDWNTVDERGAIQQTSDLSSVLQEVVDRAGYTSSDALNMIISHTAGSRNAVSYDNAPNDSPEIFVTYTVNGPSDTQAPIAPTLSSTAQTDTTVDLSWTAATDDTAVTSYKVYKDAALETTLGNVLSYQVTGLTAATAYNFTVTALDAAGNESVVSNTLAITTNPASGGGSGHWSLNNQDVYYNTGNVGIGTTTPDEKLAVNGHIHAKEIRVDLNNWPDYVFTKSYDLPTLKQVEKYIKNKGHLPNIPSAKEVEENGILLGDMNAKLLEKIEELTLYILQQQRKIDKKDTVILDLEERLKTQESRLKKIENLLKL